MENITTIRELTVKYGKRKNIVLDKDKTLNKSTLMHNALRKIFDKDTIDYRETFYVLFLDNALKPIGYTKIGDGGMDSILVDTRIIFSNALLIGASKLVLSHNHPSGTLYPSSADRTLTDRIVSGAKLLNMQVIDHLILSPKNEYFSFADDGLMFN